MKDRFTILAEQRCLQLGLPASTFHVLASVYHLKTTVDAIVYQIIQLVDDSVQLSRTDAHAAVNELIAQGFLQIMSEDQLEELLRDCLRHDIYTAFATVHADWLAECGSVEFTLKGAALLTELDSFSTNHTANTNPYAHGQSICWRKLLQRDPKVAQVACIVVGTSTAMRDARLESEVLDIDGLSCEIQRSGPLPCKWRDRWWRPVADGYYSTAIITCSSDSLPRHQRLCPYLDPEEFTRLENYVNGLQWVRDLHDTRRIFAQPADDTPLGCAARSDNADVETLRVLLEAGADINAPLMQMESTPVGAAACSGSLVKTRFLLDAGGQANFVTPHGYSILVQVIHALNADERLVEMLDLLMQHGADINRASNWGESPLSVAYQIRRFDAVKFLLTAGANPAPLRWTPLMMALALGTSDEVQQQLQNAPSLEDCDRFGRTPWLLAASVGDLAKLQLLYPKCRDINQRGRHGETALAICATAGHVEMLEWLLEYGADIEAVDDSGTTPLMLAVEAGHVACVQRLLEQGALVHRRNANNSTAISMTRDESILSLLRAIDDDFRDVSTELKRRLLGLPEKGSLHTTESDYLAGRERQFGRSNPEWMNVPFWYAVIRSGDCAYQARKAFNDTGRFSTPVWCFDRFGMSFTELPDGWIVQIGGEHEDAYDPDFCIYNEVIVHNRSGEFEVLGYPEDVFPPTDFHTATYVDGSIYIVGRLGYWGTRKFGETPVYRLDCNTWSMHPVETSGDNPGWIFKHKATLDGSHNLIISEGQICGEVGGEEGHFENAEQFRLDLRTMRWSRLTK